MCVIKAKANWLKFCRRHRNLVVETSLKSIKLRMQTESVLGPDKEYIIYEAIVCHFVIKVKVSLLYNF